MTVKILGISAYYHDSAAALLIDGSIAAAAQEERFTRKKHDPAFPKNAIRYCLREAGLSIADLDYIVFYDKPLLKFERLLETYLAYAPQGVRSFLRAMPVWLKNKLFLKKILRKELAALAGIHSDELPELRFTEHHQAHAAAAFFPSPFKRAAVLCLDGVGEWATTTAWIGEQNRLTPLWEIDFPHSLGLLYSAFTYYLGFKVNSGEYKLMGLAPYGEPKYVELICTHLVDIKKDGSFRLNMDYFNFAAGLTMTNRKFHQLFGGNPRKPESDISQKEMDLACSIQTVTEDIVLKLAKTVKRELNADNLCLSGGVALNCVANGKLLQQRLFKDIWVQPASGDAGGALGAAYSIWHEYLENNREYPGNDKMQGSYLGPGFGNEEIKQYLDRTQAEYEQFEDARLLPKVAELIAGQNVIGWFQGRMEFGPRALGNRSIIGDPRNPGMQAKINLKIKYRESFRPFAPAVKAEEVAEWFEMTGKSPYMLFVADIKKEKQIQFTAEDKKKSGIDRLTVSRSAIPAVTHIDYSARVQTVHKKINGRFYNLIECFEKLTGCPVLINTSFNVRGEPIVCAPEHAYQCFMNTEMDYLVIENFLLSKKAQPEQKKGHTLETEYELD